MPQRFPPLQQGAYLSKAGYYFCLLFTVGTIHFPTIGKLSELFLITVGFWCIYRYGRGVPTFTPMMLLLISIIIPFISWSIAYYSYPDWVKDTPQLEKMARWFLFIPLAWFLKDRPSHVFCFWGLSALMILLSPWLSGEGWHEIQRIWQGERIDYNLRNAQHTALFFGFVLIGLLSFLPRLFQCNKLLIVPWLIAIVLSFLTLVGAQTRASWLALIVAVIISLVYLILLPRAATTKIHKRWLISIGGFFLVVLIPLKMTLWPVIDARLDKESQVIEQLAQFDFDDIPYTSIGIRLNTWKAGMENFVKLPFTGWGGQGQDIAIKHSDWLPNWVKQQFGHMHNIYIALLLQYGIVGLLFYIALCGWLVVGVLKAVQRKQLPRDIGFFTVATFCYWSVMGMAESYLFFWTGVVCIQTLFAGMLALLWHQQYSLLETKPL